jgi:hypothetical protein
MDEMPEISDIPMGLSTKKWMAKRCGWFVKTAILIGFVVLLNPERVMLIVAHRAEPRIHFPKLDHTTSNFLH